MTDKKTIVTAMSLGGKNPSLVITVPSRIVKSLKLKAGDKFLCKETNGKIVYKKLVL